LTSRSGGRITADTTHAVLGENTTRSMLYVAITRGRETNTAYIYQRATEQEYGLGPLHGAHVMDRGTAFHAGRLARAIIANHDQPITADEVAAQPTAPHCLNACAASTIAAHPCSSGDGQPTKAGKQTRRASPGR
jgi:hypothetical protein